MGSLSPPATPGAAFPPPSAPPASLMVLPAAKRTSETSATMRALAWFFVILFVLIAIVLIIYIIVVNNHPNRDDAKFRKICTRELDVLRDAEIQGVLHVAEETKTRVLSVSHVLALQPKENSNGSIELSGCHSSVVLTSSTSTPVQLFLPLGSGVQSGFLMLIVNRSMANSFVVQPSGADTLNGSTAPITVTTRSALFYSTGILTTASTYDWVQLQF